jgi:hypothetical protein
MIVKLEPRFSLHDPDRPRTLRLANFGTDWPLILLRQPLLSLQDLYRNAHWKLTFEKGPCFS